MKSPALISKLSILIYELFEPDLRMIKEGGIVVNFSHE
jgi:hypothetical protein